ncbi:MAG: peptidase U32 family protein [Thermodesulfobacteriota bacterium]|nr:peptidase U32 family protein [Thermodesulfobacteriota bacterium]
MNYLPIIRNQKADTGHPVPEILAPAGSKASFLAALAAGADSVYCGMKQFSARMEAKNFGLEELDRLTKLAHVRRVKVYIAFNSLLKTVDLNRAADFLNVLSQWIKPDGLIIQDLSLVSLARQAGFTGEIHLSTLAHVSFPTALNLVRKKFGIDRVVVPRELNIDEIKALAKACPDGLGLEVFVHGALCYGVSGRCYWSSFLGGKSGLRGRCVQPCRRIYTQRGQKQRSFSCQDLSLDVLSKVLLSIPQVRAWKIEGRKKGPHYVYHTARAYRIMRDFGSNPEKKKFALGLLQLSLGRTGTHYNFLPQRPQNPVKVGEQTGSGLLLGKLQGGDKRPYLIPKVELFQGDTLRLGYEDEPWHAVQTVSKYVPTRGRLYLKFNRKKRPAKATPVFLTDRKENPLKELLAGLEKKLADIPASQVNLSETKAGLPRKSFKKTPLCEINIYRVPVKHRPKGQETGCWISDQSHRGMSVRLYPKTWWFLPPTVWPEGENDLKSLVTLALKRGGRNFILNAPWQKAFFSGMAKNSKSGNRLSLWAGPFCNLTNPLSIGALISLGFSGAIVSPELSGKDYLTLPQQSPLPLGIVLSGHWPLCISRIMSKNIREKELFTSPRGEQAWGRSYGPDFWVYPNWKLDISKKKDALKKAGYRLFVHLHEPLPKGIKLKERPGMWNWDLGLR